MRWQWIGIIAVLLLLLALSLLGVCTQAATILGSVRTSWLSAAAALCSAGYLIFSSIWAFCILMSSDPALSDRPFCSYIRFFWISIMSIIGLVTPMNLGTDVMRSMLGKRYLQLEVSSTAAASILARECKLYVALLLIPAVVMAAGAQIENSHGRLMATFAGLLGLSVSLLLLRSDGARRLAQKFKLEDLTDTLSLMSRRIGWKWRSAFCLLFAAGFAAEWQALRICFEGLGIPSDPGATFVCFGLFYFLSRIPVLPLGIGVVETAGFAWLLDMQVPVGKAGALVILWGFLRITVPFLLAAGGFLANYRGRPVSKGRTA